MKLQLGLNKCSNSEYHADKTYLSSTVLKTILHDIEEYKRHYIDGEPKPAFKNRNALDEGSLAHALILEPHTVETDFAFYPGPFKKGKDYEAFASKQVPGHPIISSVQRSRVNELVRAYRQRESATALLQNAEVEYTICAILNDVPVKVRFDAVQLEKGIISDVKTTGYSGEIDSFKQTISDLEYDLSAALYTMVAEQHFGRPFDFYFIVLSKQDNSCHVYKTSQETLRKGRRKVVEALTKYKRCKETGLWVDSHTAQVESGPYEVLEV